MYINTCQILPMLLMLGAFSVDIVLSDDKKNYTLNQFTYDCKLNETLFKPAAADRDASFYIVTSDANAVQQVVSRIYAIYLRQIARMKNVYLVQTDYLADVNMTVETVTDGQAQIMTDLKIANPSSYVVNLGLPDTCAYSIQPFPNANKIGPLGMGARYAWFLPRHNDELGDIHISIERFTKAEFGVIVKLFQLDVSELLAPLNVIVDRRYTPDNCRQSDCAILLADHYEHTAFLTEHIRRLRLQVQVLWLGNQLYRVQRALITNASNKMFLFFAQTPSALVRNATDYRIVSMAPMSYLLGDLEAAFYDQSSMFKYSSSRWDIGAIKFDGKQTALLDIIERGLAEEGMAILSADFYEKIGCEWLNQADENTSKMLSPKPRAKPLGVMCPPGRMFEGVEWAAERAFAEINAMDASVFDNVKLESYFDASLHSLINLDNENGLAMIGPEVKEISIVAEYLEIPVISYSSAPGTHDGLDKHTFNFRITNDRQQLENVYIELFAKLDWKRVALLVDSELSHFSQLATSMYNASIEVETVLLPNNATHNDVEMILGSLRARDYRIFIAEIRSAIANQVLCEAFKLQMTGDQQHVWFLPAEIIADSLSEFNETRCEAKDLLAARNGALALYTVPLASDSSLLHENTNHNATVAEWRRSYNNDTQFASFRRFNGSADLPSVAGFAYDAVWAFALALNQTRNRKSSHDFGRALRDSLERTDMRNGVSGNVSFANRNSRVADINVGQWWESQFRLVYRMEYKQPVTARNKRNGAADRQSASKPQLVCLNGCVWPAQPISDGRPPCHLHSLATWLGISCSSAIVTVYSLLVVVCMIATLVVMYVFWERRYRRRLEREASMLRSFGIDLLGKQVDETRIDKSEIPRHRLVLNRRLGGGQFGTVYFGQLRHEDDRCEQVAIKTPENANNFNLRLEFLSEAQAMRRFDHPNIVRLVGVSLLADPMYIVMEYMILGDLNMYLLSRRQQITCSNREEWARRLTGFVLDLSRGLAYMAELRYVHRDIACRNCLLTGSGEHITAKLADFGMSRPVYSNDVYQFRRRGALPVRWSAPESMQTGTYSTASDMWSFGVLMWEIITLGAYPYHEVHDDQVLLSLVRDGRTLTIPSHVNEDLRWLISECWHLRPKLRIRARELVDFVSTRELLVEPCAVGGPDEFAQIYEMNNEPAGRWRKSNGQQQPVGLQQQQPVGQQRQLNRAEGLSNGSAVELTMRNNLNVPSEPSHVFNNCNYTSGGGSGGGEGADGTLPVNPNSVSKAYMNSLASEYNGGSVDRPLLTRHRIRTWRQTVWRKLVGWTEALWMRRDRRTVAEL